VTLSAVDQRNGLSIYFMLFVRPNRNERGQVIKSHIFDKGSAVDHIDVLSMPSWDFPCHFVPKVLKVYTPKMPNR
jgi:hypothetical protein